jgi:hypothetical protein
LSSASVRKEIRRHCLESALAQLQGVDALTRRKVQDPASGDEFSETVAHIVVNVPASGELF